MLSLLQPLKRMPNPDMEAMAVEDMAATEDMEAMATITARGPLMLSLLQLLKPMPNPDTEAMVAMEAMVDTEGMATITARGPLMLRPDMEAMEDTDTEAMVAMAAMVVMVTVTDMAVDTDTMDKPVVEYPKLSRVQ